MNTYLSILLLFVSINAYPQKGDHDFQSEYGKAIEKENIVEYIDSLKVSLLKDTANFSRENLIHFSIGSRSKKPNTPLFVINGRYFYDLNIIAGDGVVEFIENVLDPKYIKDLIQVKPNYAQALYGLYGEQGAILITLKRRVNFNPEIAGLKLQGKRKGNNFDQRKTGDIIIRY